MASTSWGCRDGTGDLSGRPRWLRGEVWGRAERDVVLTIRRFRVGGFMGFGF